MQGYVTPFADWPEEVKGYYTYDPEGAEALLDEAGYPRGADGIRLEIVLNVGLPHWDVAYNDLAASFWAEVGVDVEVRGSEWAGFIPKMNVTIQALLKGTRDNLFQSLYIVGRVWLR